MIPGRRQNERVAADDLMLEVAEVGFQGEESRVELAPLDALHENGSLVLRPQQAETREGLAQRRIDCRQQVWPDGRNDAEAQRSGERIDVTLRHFGQILGLEQHAPRPRHQLLARRRQKHPPPIALEEPHAERSLQLGHLRAQRGLRHVAALGGAAEALRVGDRDDVLELAEGQRQGAHGVDSQLLSTLLERCLGRLSSGRLGCRPGVTGDR